MMPSPVKSAASIAVTKQKERTRKKIKQEGELVYVHFNIVKRDGERKARRNSWTKDKNKK